MFEHNFFACETNSMPVSSHATGVARHAQSRMQRWCRLSEMELQRLHRSLWERWRWCSPNRQPMGPSLQTEFRTSTRNFDAACTLLVNLRLVLCNLLFTCVQYIYCLSGACKHTTQRHDTALA